MNEQEWNVVPSWPSYEVDRVGNVRNATTRRVLKLQPHHRGHLYWFPKRGVRMYVHRAVLEAFSGPASSPLLECRHLDGNPANNRLENLVWGTASENTADKRRHGTMPLGERSGTAKLTEEDVRRIRQMVGTHSLRELAGLFGVSHTAVRRAANGTKWSHVA